MGAICSKSPVDDVADHPTPQADEKSRFINSAASSTNNGNPQSKSGTSSPTNASFRSKSKRQAAVSIVGADDDGDINDLDNSKRSLNIDAEMSSDASNIHPHNNSGAITLSPGTTAFASTNSNPMSRTSSPPAGGHRSGKDSVLSNMSLTKEQSIGDAPASELPPGSVIRRDNSISMPTRRRGSSVSLVLTPDQHLSSGHCRSPPAPVLSRDGSGGDGEANNNNNNMEDLDLGGSSIANAVIESQIQYMKEHGNPLSRRSSSHHIPESTARRLSSPDENNNSPQHQQQHGNSNSNNILERISAEHHHNIPMSLSRKGSLSNRTSGGSPVRGEQSFAGDEPDAEKLDATGTTLLLPTHRRQRGSSVALKMSPEDHLKSPRIDSPSQMKSFHEVSKNMAPLSLGKKLLEAAEQDEEEDSDHNGK